MQISALRPAPSRLSRKNSGGLGGQLIRGIVRHNNMLARVGKSQILYQRHHMHSAGRSRTPEGGGSRQGQGRDGPVPVPGALRPSAGRTQRSRDKGLAALVPQSRKLTLKLSPGQLSHRHR